MATIGLDKLYYSKITEDTSGSETYATPVSLAKAMTAELSVELAEATLYADDGAAEVELLTSPMELTDYKTAITEALYKGTKRNVESEKDAKNAQVG